MWGVQRCHTYKIAVLKYQGRCELRSEVFVKIQKKKNLGGGGGGGGHKVDVNKELKFL